jgi:nucleoside-diphosphate-sugar epimerase
MKFSVLGCGWLGLPLAEFLVKKEFLVKGSTTSREKLPLLKSKKIHPYLIEISNQSSSDSLEDFLQTDVLFVNIPFGQQKENLQAYIDLIPKIEKSSVQKVIFVSSTSVYADTNGTITDTENFKINPAKQRLIDLENLFRNNKHFDCTVLRFSGLVGGSRNPGNWLRST